MSIRYINTGSGANSGDGDSLRSAFIKVNSNFTEILSIVNNGNGYTGSRGAGYTGSRGIQGPMGPQGYTGSTGTQGIIGYTGSIGANTSEQLTWSYYSTEADLPNASTKHGMFAHVHGTGYGYMAHAGVWIKLANFSDIISAFGEGFSLTGTNKIVTNKLYSTNQTESTQHYRLELDTNGVIILPDQSIINGSTLRGVYGTGDANYTGITIGPDSNHREESWVWVDHTGVSIATEYSTSAYTWKFDNNGKLTLPAGGNITSSDYNFSFNKNSGKTGAPEIGTDITYATENLSSDILDGEVYMGSGYGEFRSIYNKFEGIESGLAYAGVEGFNYGQFGDVNFAGMVSQTPNIDSMYTVSLNTSGQITIGFTQNGQTQQSTDWSVVVGSLNTDMTVNGLFADTNKTVISGRYGIELNTDRGTIHFGNHPEIGIASHFHIMRDDPEHVDLFFGDDNNYVKLPHYSTLTNVGIEIGANNNLWTFDTNGALTLPAGSILSEALYAETVTLDQLTDISGWVGTLVFTKQNSTTYQALPDGPLMSLLGEFWLIQYDATSWFSSTDLVTWVVGGYAGNTAPVGTLSAGTTTLTVGGNTWQFSTDGKLTLPNGSTIGDSDAVFGVPITTARGTILLGNQAECGNVNHFHIMKAGQQDIELLLGDDNNYVKLPSTGGVEISSSEVGAQHYWNFGTDTTLTIPGDIQDANGSLIFVATTSTAPTRVEGQLWFNTEDGRAYIRYDNTWLDLSPPEVPPLSTYLDGLTIEGTTISAVDSTATVSIESGANIWEFGTDGSLTLPEGGVIKNSTGTNILDGLGGAGANFEYSTVQEGLSVGPFGGAVGVTSITGNHDTNTGVGLTSDKWAQLMWVPDTSVVTVDDIDNGPDVYNWAYAGSQGFHITNHVNTGTTHEWLFGSTGTITLPQGGVISETYANGGQSILLTPYAGSGNNPDMAVKIYPTFNDDDHIHITAGNPSTVDLFLGDDDQYVKLEQNGGNIVVGTNADTNQWTFGTDGKTSLASGVEISNTGTFNFLSWNTGTALIIADVPYTAGSYIYIPSSSDTNGSLGIVNTNTSGSIMLTQGNGNTNNQLYVNNSGTTINNILGGISKTWTFGTDGSVTFPDATVQTTAYVPATASASTYTGWFKAAGTVVQLDTLLARINSTGTMQISSTIVESIGNGAAFAWNGVRNKGATMSSFGQGEETWVMPGDWLDISATPLDNDFEVATVSVFKLGGTGSLYRITYVGATNSGWAVNIERVALG